jgi:hypothetical protein
MGQDSENKRQNKNSQNWWYTPFSKILRRFQIEEVRKLKLIKFNFKK